MPSDLLIEMRVERPKKAPSGFRVWADGRYESLEPDARWLANRRERWRLMWTYDAQEQAALRGVIEAGFEGLERRYAPSGRVEDGGRVLWRARIDGRTRRVEVEAGARVAALEGLLKAINGVKRRPQPSSTWRIWRGDGVIVHEVRQDENALPRFQALNGRLYGDPQARFAPPDTPAKAGDTPRLAEALYREGDQVTGRVMILEDGRVIGDGRLMLTLSPPGLEAVKGALGAIEAGESP